MNDAASSSGGGSGIYLGAGLGVGGAILVAIVVLTWQIARKRAQHRRALAQLERHGEMATTTAIHDRSDVPRPVGVPRCSTVNPLQSRAGWSALYSDEKIHEPQAASHLGRQKQKSAPLPRKFKQRAIPLRRLKHLSAIIESPRSRSGVTPSPVMHASATAVSIREEVQSGGRLSLKKTTTLVQHCDGDEDVFTMPGSPEPHVLPSFAIRSPGMYRAAIANDERPCPPRSISVGALTVPVPENAKKGPVWRPLRPAMHVRSISLGAPQGNPPLGPVPPVPALLPKQRSGSDENHRQGVFVSRPSSSSGESANSSVLITSPILKMHEDKPASSPTVEDVVAEDDSATLKAGSNRRMLSQLDEDVRGNRQAAAGAASAAGFTQTIGRQTSVCANVVSWSNESSRLSGFSVGSENEDPLSASDRLFIPQIAIADKVSISRVSSYNSLSSTTASAHRSPHGGVQKISTPHRKCRPPSVSATGSPAERSKTSVLRDISGNGAVTPSRQPSNSTQNSGRSSNGNPFQWDQSLPLMKPSALKGSPNSKGSKGHKRQNCVRISTLTPQILGPPPSRPTSPSIMHGIEEESSEDGTTGFETECSKRLVGTQRPRPLRNSSTGSICRSLRVQTVVRASLTPSSPTLSTWAAYQDQQAQADDEMLSRQNSDNYLSVSPVSPLSAKATARPGSRLSDCSSVSTCGFSHFPSPSKATLGRVEVRQQAVPQFCLSRPSTDEAEPEYMSVMGSSPPFALRAASTNDSNNDDGKIFPSSPPEFTTRNDDTEYDPARPVLVIPSLGGAPEYDPAAPIAGHATLTEYDPASPWWPQTPVAGIGVSRSSPTTSPFVTQPAISGTSPGKSCGCELPDTPPCSPKTIPQDVGLSVNKHRASPIVTSPTFSASDILREKLTSANASSIMATVPEHPPAVGFPSAIPVLPLPAPPTCGQSTPVTRRQRSVSKVVVPSFQSSEEDGSWPRPLNVSPKGPRSEPAKSVLKSATALRRMNSEIDQTHPLHRESRRYVHLGREASPLLPWICSPDPSESCNDLFDFDFASLDTTGGAVEGYDAGQEGQRSELDNIYISALSRTLDGALAGFSCPPASSSNNSMYTLERPSSGRSVWEDGERFWEPLSAPIDMTPTKQTSGMKLRRTQGSVTPIRETTADLLEPPSSIMKTPRSLYDSDGFLRT